MDLHNSAFVFLYFLSIFAGRILKYFILLQKREAGRRVDRAPGRGRARFCGIAVPPMREGFMFSHRGSI